MNDVILFFELYDFLISILLMRLLFQDEGVE